MSLEQIGKRQLEVYAAMLVVGGCWLSARIRRVLPKRLHKCVCVSVHTNTPNHLLQSSMKNSVGYRKIIALFDSISLPFLRVGLFCCRPRSFNLIKKRFRYHAISWSCARTIYWIVPEHDCPTFFVLHRTTCNEWERLSDFLVVHNEMWTNAFWMGAFLRLNSNPNPYRKPIQNPLVYDIAWYRVE